jgi:hypothetical protein
MQEIGTLVLTQKQSFCPGRSPHRSGSVSSNVADVRDLFNRDELVEVDDQSANKFMSTLLFSERHPYAAALGHHLSNLWSKTSGFIIIVKQFVSET